MSVLLLKRLIYAKSILIIIVNKKSKKCKFYFSIKIYLQINACKNFRKFS